MGHEPGRDGMEDDKGKPRGLQSGQRSKSTGTECGWTDLYRDWISREGLGQKWVLPLPPPPSIPNQTGGVLSQRRPPNQSGQRENRIRAILTEGVTAQQHLPHWEVDRKADSRPHPRPTESETPGVEPGMLSFNKPFFQGILKQAQAWEPG